MATYTITINEKTAEGKKFVDFMKALSFVSVAKPSKKAIEKKEKDPTEMTKAEFYAKLERSRAQFERGEYIEVKPENFKKFLGLE
jgi:hypothetical protein